MKTEYKFIHFRRINDKEWAVKNNKTKGHIGEISYYSPWRQYVFEGFSGCVFNNTCLADIQHFIGQLNKQQAKAK